MNTHEPEQDDTPPNFWGVAAILVIVAGLGAWLWLGEWRWAVTGVLAGTVLTAAAGVATRKANR